MGAVTFRAKTELRHRLRSALLLVLAIGIAGGATLTALAGARRTRSAIDRFVTYAHPADGGVSADPVLYDRIARLPHVVDTARTARFGMVRLDADGRPITHDPFGAIAISRPGHHPADPAVGPPPTRRPARRGRDQRDRPHATST